MNRHPFCRNREFPGVSLKLSLNSTPAVAIHSAESLKSLGILLNFGQVFELWKCSQTSSFSERQPASQPAGQPANHFGPPAWTGQPFPHTGSRATIVVAFLSSRSRRTRLQTRFGILTDEKRRVGLRMNVRQMLFCEPASVCDTHVAQRLPPPVHLPITTIEVSARCGR